MRDPAEKEKERLGKEAGVSCHLRGMFKEANHRRPAQLDEIALREHLRKGRPVIAQQPEQFVVRDVAGRDEKQLWRCAVEDEPIHEIPILAHHDPAFVHCAPPHLPVGRAILRGQFEGVDRIRTERGQLTRDPARQLRIHDELHTATGSLRFVRASRAAHAYTACRSAGSRSS